MSEQTNESEPQPNHKIELGPISGKAGEVKIVSAKADRTFNAWRLVAKDTDKGMATRVRMVWIRNVPQRPMGGGGTLTLFFSENALGNGIVWDVMHADDEIKFEIEFINASTWSAIVEGEAK